MRKLSHIIGQITGVVSGVGTCLLWNFAMWGPTSILTLSGTSFSGAFVMSILAIVTVIASLRGHTAVLLLMFFISFCPIGFFFLNESHWLSWTGVLNLGYLLAAILMSQTRKSAVTDASQNI